MGGGAAALALGAALILWGSGAATALGLPAQETIALLLLAAAALSATGWAVERARPSGREAVGAVAMWAVFVAAAGTLYASREAAVARLREMVEDAGFGAPATEVTSGGDVTVPRRWDGSFVIGARVGGEPVDFIFDTGASSTVLTSETAQRLGIDMSRLRFVVPVLTANGRTLTAKTVLDRVSIGPIGLVHVPALVSAPGALHQNLLGNTILDRLDSYEVRANRLVLRSRKR